MAYGIKQSHGAARQQIKTASLTIQRARPSPVTAVWLQPSPFLGFFISSSLPPPMATFLPVQRRPLASRSLQTTNPSPPSKQPRVVSGAKRARSPDHTENQTHTAPKRVRSTVEPVPRPTASASAKAREHAKDKQNRLTERLQREEEFKRKYKKDFPGWRFYIDSENLDSKLESQFKTKILRLGGVCNFPSLVQYPLRKSPSVYSKSTNSSPLVFRILSQLDRYRSRTLTVIEKTKRTPTRKPLCVVLSSLSAGKLIKMSMLAIY